jgi:hypothetical protein
MSKKLLLPLLDILPGSNKKVIDTSSQLPENILKMLDQQPKDTVDTLVLSNGDVWRYFNVTKSIFDHPYLQNKNVFLQTLGYNNTKISNKCWEISYPIWYWSRKKSLSQFMAKSVGLKYGFSCLNNKDNCHRMMLGYHLHKNNLLDGIIFSQNIVNDAYSIHRIAQDAEVLNLIDFNEYKKLLPIRYNEPNDPNLNFATDHSIFHDAYTKAYCNIVTESECEEYPYEKNINLPTVTEKSYKPFLAGQVPIMLAARGHIAYFKSLGFEMMEDLLPINYDQMTVLQKINAIILVILKGNKFIEDFYFSHLKEIQHNYELVNSDKIEKLMLQNIKNIL